MGESYAYLGNFTFDSTNENFLVLEPVYSIDKGDSFYVKGKDETICVALAEGSSSD